MALIEQGGRMKAQVVPNVSYKNLGAVLRENVQSDAVICSDENTAYKTVNKEFKAHHTVNHSEKEYILKTPDGISAGTNHCESFFSLLKRGVHGAWHNVSREHLPKYVNEFEFRWNTRKMTDGARMATAIPMVEGKRLFYRRPE
jgi:transposase-like protein